MENIEVTGSRTLFLGLSLTLQFHRQFEFRSKVSKIEYYLVKVGISSQDFQNLIMTRVNLKLGGGTPVKTNFNETPTLVHSFLLIYYFILTFYCGH